MPEFHQNLPQGLTNIPTPDLAIVGWEGKDWLVRYLDREVVLAGSEVTEVKDVALRAMERVAREELARVQSLQTKRRRRVRTKAQVPSVRDARGAEKSVPPPVTPKKRGRPPKQRLDGSVS